MRLVLAVLLVPAVASASGFYTTENGAKTLAMGGAFAGEADDLSAIEHNPAGLSQLTGFHFLLDGQLVFHSIKFDRQDPGFDAANPPAPPGNSVYNQAGPFPVPMLGIGYGLKLLGRTLFIAGGVYGPPSVGKYSFPAPKYEKDAMGKYVENPRKFSPQRYALISNNILIIYPTIALSYEVLPGRFSLGVSLQPVLGEFHFSQAVTSITRVFSAPQKQADENPLFDSIVNVDLPMQYLGFTAVVGAHARPIDMLGIGVSFRPQIMINAKGKLGIELGEAATSLNTTVTGDQTTLSLMLPAELKVGINVRPISKLGINFDFIYQGWQSVQELVLDPQEVYLKTGTDAPVKVAGFRIQKHWNAAYSFRLGASYDLFDWLALYLGGWYETGAIPDQYIGVDFLNFARVYFTGGVGVKFAGLELLLGAGGSPTTSHAVTQSEVLAGSTEPTPAGVIGAGVYTSGNFMLSLGIRGHFGGAPKPAAPKPEEPAPAPAPAPSPSETPNP